MMRVLTIHAIKGKEADLNAFCRHKRLEGKEVAALHVGEEVAEGHEAEEDPDPRINDERWQYPCRMIRAAFINDILRAAAPILFDHRSAQEHPFGHRQISPGKCCLRGYLGNPSSHLHTVDGG
jgi:hypothetical protein